MKERIFSDDTLAEANLGTGCPALKEALEAAQGTSPREMYAILIQLNQRSRSERTEFAPYLSFMSPDRDEVGLWKFAQHAGTDTTLPPLLEIEFTKGTDTISSKKCRDNGVVRNIE